jgi:hypothetical protein
MVRIVNGEIVADDDARAGASVQRVQLHPPPQTPPPPHGRPQRSAAQRGGAPPLLAVRHAGGGLLGYRVVLRGVEFDARLFFVVAASCVFLGKHGRCSASLLQRQLQQRALAALLRRSCRALAAPALTQLCALAVLSRCAPGLRGLLVGAIVFMVVDSQQRGAPVPGGGAAAPVAAAERGAPRLSGGDATFRGRGHKLGSS